MSTTMATPTSPVCKEKARLPKRKLHKHLRPLPLYTATAAADEVALGSQSLDPACMNLLADAGAAARRARSPAGPPAYDTLYSPQAATPIYSAIAERIEFLHSPTEDDGCATCQAAVSCPIHPIGKKSRTL